VFAEARAVAKVFAEARADAKAFAEARADVKAFARVSLYVLRWKRYLHSSGSRNANVELRAQ
jgi:hypothetical protein